MKALKVKISEPAEAVQTAWGMICPSCLQDDALDVTARVSVRLTKGGTDIDASADGSHEWDKDSSLRCASCGWTGTVLDAEHAHDRFAEVELDTALCVWEHMLEKADEDGAPYGKLFWDLGNPAMRACAPHAARLVDAVYQKMLDEGYELTVPFDREMVPAVADRLDWKALTNSIQFNGAPYRPDIEDLFYELCEAMPDNFHRSDPKADWMASAKAECIRQWRYADLLSDHPERTEAAYEAGEKPIDFVKELGERYGLNSARDFLA